MYNNSFTYCLQRIFIKLANSSYSVRPKETFVYVSIEFCTFLLKCKRFLMYFSCGLIKGDHKINVRFR